MATKHLRQQTVRQPTALLISHNPSVLAAVHTALTAAQFAVFATASPLAGYEYALHTLGLTVPSRITTILIDTSNVYSVLVAAGLSQRMQQGAIPRTRLIALLDTREPERALEAHLAGCQQVLHLPLAEAAIRALQKQIKRLAPLPVSTTAFPPAQVITTVQTIADRMLHAALDVQPDQWTAQDVSCLLSYLTPYPVYAESATTREVPSLHRVDMHLRTEQMIRTLGGIQGARHFLAECVCLLEEQYLLHSQVLEKFLDGWQRKTIVKHFVERGFYEDTRMYSCIKELPQRMSDMLKVHGI